MKIVQNPDNLNITVYLSRFLMGSMQWHNELHHPGVAMKIARPESPLVTDPPTTC